MRKTRQPFGEFLIRPVQLRPIQPFNLAHLRPTGSGRSPGGFRVPHAGVSLHGPGL